MTGYEDRIRNRSTIRFLIGLIPRSVNYIRCSIWRRIAIFRGATIGKNTVIPRKLALRANRNLVVGSHCSISTSDLDLRSQLTIGNHVIIGRGVKIILASHNYNSPSFETYYTGLEIGDYVWLTTNCMILPKTRQIGYGAICGASSVVTKAVGDMEIVGGNPARIIGNRKCVHDKIPVEFLQGYDLIKYVKTYFSKDKE